METFNLYVEAWAAYFGLGLLLLGLIYYKIRDRSGYLKFGLISFLAVGAFTPSFVGEGKTFAPLVINSLLNAEIEGSGAILSGFFQLVIVWAIVCLIALASSNAFSKSKK